MENIQNENFYNKVIELFQNAKKNLSAAVNMTMVYSYYEAGRIIVEEEQGGKERAAYGKHILKELSQRLTQKFGRGYSYDNLKLMRKFYLVYSKDSIGETPFPQSEKLPVTQEGRKFYLSWSHYLVLMRINNIEERLALSRNKEEVMRLATEGQMLEKPEDIFKDPYILEFTGLQEMVTYSETELENRIIDNLQKFLLELGRGFTFVGRQMRICTETTDFYIDLVFYNYILKCFVLIDLKTTKLTHQDIGQMDMYVRMFDDLKRREDDNPTIGIIFCTDKDETMVKYSVLHENQQIFASKYMTVLPTIEELQKELERNQLIYNQD